MKNYEEPFAPGHLKSGGVELQMHTFTCSLCGVEFENLNPNAKACDKCRPELHKLSQRRSAAKLRRKREAERLKRK